MIYFPDMETCPRGRPRGVHGSPGPRLLLSELRINQLFRSRRDTSGSPEEKRAGLGTFQSHTWNSESRQDPHENFDKSRMTERPQGFNLPLSRGVSSLLSYRAEASGRGLNPRIECCEQPCSTTLNHRGRRRTRTASNDWCPPPREGSCQQKQPKVTKTSDKQESSGRILAPGTTCPRQDRSCCNEDASVKVALPPPTSQRSVETFWKMPGLDEAPPHQRHSGSSPS